MDISQLIDFDSLLPTTQARLLTGDAGLGKSSVVRMIAQKRGMRVVDLRLSELEPADLVGMPFVDKIADGTVVTRYAAPTWWYDLENAVLFLDEIDRAREDMQPLAMQLTLDRRAGGRTLPDSTIVFAAGNGLKYQTATLDQALCNRFAIVDFTPTSSEWVSWASDPANGVHPAVVQFITQHKNLLDIPEGKRGVPNEAVTSRRSWTFLGRTLMNREDTRDSLPEVAARDNRLMVYAAPFIGEVAANTFSSWVRDNFKPLDIMDIFNGKLKSPKGFQLTQVIQALRDVMEVMNRDDIKDEQRINAALFYSRMGHEPFSAFFEALDDRHGDIINKSPDLKAAVRALLDAKAKIYAKPAADGTTAAASTEAPADSDDGDDAPKRGRKKKSV
jgi:hypothetical protein